MRRILLIMISTNLLLYANFNRNSSGVVADSNTGLIWQDDYSDNEGEIKRATWTNALIYCEELSLGTKNDWRVPNENELLSITDIKDDSNSISSIFINIILNTTNYWSSTTSTMNRGYAWTVIFKDSGNSTTGIYSKRKEKHVMCVRSQIPNR